MTRCALRSLPVIFVLVLTTAGCNSVPDYQMRQAQLRSMQMYRQNQSLSAQLGQAQQSAAQLAAERAQLQQQLAIAGQRLDNLNSERTALHDRYRHLLTASGNPLPGATNDRFRDLAERYPDFEFDPQTGVSKFNSDLLFALGSDTVRPDAQKLLKEFAAIMNSDEAQQFNILVVGHTDDIPIKKSGTAAKHASNWELSVHRGTSVVHALAKHGVKENRMGVSGYSMYQPISPNTNDENRQKNRRVEIYVLAPDARVATGG